MVNVPHIAAVRGLKSTNIAQGSINGRNCSHKTNGTSGQTLWLPVPAPATGKQALPMPELHLAEPVVEHRRVFDGAARVPPVPVRRESHILPQGVLVEASTGAG